MRAADVRKLAHSMCQIEFGDCVMDEIPRRPVCTTKNCDMVRRALELIRQQKIELSE